MTIDRKTLPEGVSADFTRTCKVCGRTVRVVAGDEQPHRCRVVVEPRARDAITGRYVTDEHAEQHPDTTVIEHDATISRDAVRLATAARDMAATSSLNVADSTALLEHAQQLLTSWATAEDALRNAAWGTQEGTAVEVYESEADARTDVARYPRLLTLVRVVPVDAREVDR